MSEDLIERSEGDYVGTSSPDVTPEFELYDLGEYKGEIETHWWVPEKSQPTKKIRLDLRSHAMKQSDRNVIQRKINEMANRGGQINFYNRQLDQLQAPFERELDRLNKQLREVSKFDEEFAGDEEKAEAKRSQIEKQIEAKTKEHANNRKQLEDKITALLAAPSLYEIWRTDLFWKVIEDHSIGQMINGVLTKVDFSSAHPDHELPTAFAEKLQEFIWEVLNRGKASKRNGSSRK